VVGIFGLSGLIAGLQVHGIVSGIIGILFGAMFGIPIIILGQLSAVFLDQKELLEDILSVIKKK